MRAAGPLVTLLLLAASLGTAPRSAHAALSLAERVARLEREAAGKLLPVAAAAVKQGQVPLARRIYERALELDADQAVARRELGYVKGAQGWVRVKVPPAPDPVAGAEADAVRRRLEGDWLAAETARGEQVVAVCKAAGDAEAAKPHLLRVLERLPRLESAHAALGHEKVEGRYVRPALADMARRQPQVLEGFAACRTPNLEAEPSGEVLQVPGVPDLAWLRVGKRLVSGSFPADDLARRAAQTECAHRLLTLLLGPSAAHFDPPRVLWLVPPHYEAFVKSRHAEPAEQQRRLRSSNYTGNPFALRTVEAGASDIYTHNVAYFTAQSLVSPLVPDDPKRRNTDAYAWFKEGLGYFTTLTLWDTGTTSFFSNTESNAKTKGMLPPPAVRNAETLLDWMRQLVVRGEAYALAEVVTKSLNGLDFIASIQAATFVRFLAFYDPAAFQRLPGALRAQQHGSESERTDEALRTAYGKDLGDLAALWRAWLLEVA